MGYSKHLSYMVLFLCVGLCGSCGLFVCIIMEQHSGYFFSFRIHVVANEQLSQAYTLSRQDTNGLGLSVEFNHVRKKKQ